MRALAVVVILAAFVLAGCQTTPAQRGAIGGAAIGGIAGQLIGGDTEATLIGAGVGALGGALLNDHIDRQKKEAYNQGRDDASQ